MDEKPLLPWFIAESNGKVLCAHCNCMAGLGETCSHVATLLWAVEAGVRLKDSMTITQKKAYWLLPPSIKEVQYAPLNKIDFSGKSSAKQIVGSGTSLTGATPSTLADKAEITPDQSPSSSSSLTSAETPVALVCGPPSSQMLAFYRQLANSSVKPVILSIAPEYASNYIPATITAGLPSPLFELFQEDCLE